MRMLDPEAPVILIAMRDLSESRPARVELRRRGAIVLAASNPAEMFRKAYRFPPDLLILDQFLDEIDARIRLVLLRGRFPNLKVILLGALPDPGAPRLDPSFYTCAERTLTPDTLLGMVVHIIPDLKRKNNEYPNAPRLIACIDDDPLHLSAVARVLSRHGYKAFTYQDADHAMEVLPSIKPDLVILDLSLPGTDGLDVAREIRNSHGKKLPIVMLTGRSSDKDILAGYRNGASYYLTKPCEPSRILNIVDYLVGEIDMTERAILETQL